MGGLSVLRRLRARPGIFPTLIAGPAMPSVAAADGNKDEANGRAY